MAVQGNASAIGPADMGSSAGAGGMAFASMIPSLVGTFLGTANAVSQIKSQSKAIISNIKAEGRSFVYESAIISQQRNEARRELADIMSDIGLEALEAEATSRAGNAMRGVVGTSVDASSINMAMKNNLANADAIRQWQNTDVNLLRRQAMKRMEFDQRTSAMASGIQSPSSAFLGSLTGAIGGFQTGMSFMSDENRLQFYKTISGGN